MEQTTINDKLRTEPEQENTKAHSQGSVHELLERAHYNDLTTSLAGIIPAENISVQPVHNLEEVHKSMSPGGIALIDIDGVLTSSILAGLPLVRMLQPEFLFESESIEFLKTVNRQQEACAIVTNRHPGETAQRIFNSQQLLKALQTRMHQADIQIPIFQDLQRGLPTYGDPQNYTLLREFLHDNVTRLTQHDETPILYHVYDTSLIRSGVPLIRQIFSEGRFLRYTLNNGHTKPNLQDLRIKAFPIVRNL